MHVLVVVIMVTHDLLHDVIDHRVEGHAALVGTSFLGMAFAHVLDGGATALELILADDHGEGGATGVGALHLRLEGTTAIGRCAM